MMESKFTGLLALLFSTQLLCWDQTNPASIADQSAKNPVQVQARVNAETSEANPEACEPNPNAAEANPESSDLPPVKYVYAEMVYQMNYKKVTQWVSGRSVSAAIKKAVSESKYSDEALDALGEDGWELVGTATRNFTNGFEIMFYLKKIKE